MAIPESEQEAFRSQYLNVLRMAGALVAGKIFTVGAVQYLPDEVIDSAEAIVYCAWKRYDAGRFYNVGANSPLIRSEPKTRAAMGSIGDDKEEPNGK